MNPWNAMPASISEYNKDSLLFLLICGEVATPKLNTVTVMMRAA
jgi:hypothetical protein